MNKFDGVNEPHPVESDLIVFVEIGPCVLEAIGTGAGVNYDG